MNSAECYQGISPNVAQQVLARDEDLLLAARRGSHGAFAELQKIYSQRLYKRILSITRNREDAEDALQDAFLRAYLALSSFEGRSSFSSWLTRIGINSALMILRRRRARPETSFEQQVDYESDGAYMDVCDHALNPEQICDQRQRCHAIRSAIQRLDSKSRAAISIRASHELSIKQVAQILGISVASVKARLYRARKRLNQYPAFLYHTRIEAVPNHRAT